MIAGANVIAGANRLAIIMYGNYYGCNHYTTTI